MVLIQGKIWNPLCLFITSIFLWIPNYLPVQPIPTHNLHTTSLVTKLTWLVLDTISVKKLIIFVTSLYGTLATSIRLALAWFFFLIPRTGEWIPCVGHSICELLRPFTIVQPAIFNELAVIINVPDDRGCHKITRNLGIVECRKLILVSLLLA